MKKILLISLFLFGATSLFAQVQPYPKQLKPFSTFNGDRAAYLKANFGYKTNNYEFQVLKNFLNDVEVPIKTIHFQIRKLVRYNGYTPTVIRFFFDDPEVVEKAIASGKGTIDNITVTVEVMIENSSIEHMRIMAPIFKDHTEDFMIPFDENVREYVEKIFASGLVYRTEFP